MGARREVSVEMTRVRADQDGRSTKISGMFDCRFLQMRPQPAKNSRPLPIFRHNLGPL